MPKQNVNYNNTVFYKIKCNDENIQDLYIGNTTHLIKRRSQHKHNCKINHQIPLYQFINNNGGWDNWTMELIEEYPCDTLEQSRKHERDLIEQLNATINHLIPNRTKNEYMKEYKQTEKYKQYNREYAKLHPPNKEVKSERARRYYLKKKSIQDNLQDLEFV